MVPGFPLKARKGGLSQAPTTALPETPWTPLALRGPEEPQASCGIHAQQSTPCREKPQTQETPGVGTALSFKAVKSHWGHPDHLK